MFKKLIKIHGPQNLQGKIYKIVCNTTGNIYIGSTIKDLKYRLTRHLNDYVSFNNKIKGVTYRTSFEIFKNNNYQIELIENFPCYSQYFLRRREGEYQRNLECVNKFIAGRTGKELSKDKGKAYQCEKTQKYREQHRELLAKKQREYNNLNKKKINDKIACPLCGFYGSRRHLKDHQKTQNCKKE